MLHNELKHYSTVAPHFDLIDERLREYGWAFQLKVARTLASNPAESLHRCATKHSIADIEIKGEKTLTVSDNEAARPKQAHTSSSSPKEKDPRVAMATSGSAKTEGSSANVGGNPDVKKEGKALEAPWMDEKRLSIYVIRFDGWMTVSGLCMRITWPTLPTLIFDLFSLVWWPTRLCKPLAHQILVKL